MSLDFSQKITLDLTVDRIQNIHCCQEDTDSRRILVTLSEKGLPYAVPEQVSIYLKIAKPDNTFVYIDEESNATHLFRNNDGTISIILSEQATVVPGIAEAELQLIDKSSPQNHKIITSKKFNIVIRKSVADSSSILSKVESNVLNDMIYHLADHENPHKTTKAQVGLGNCDNTADIDKNVNSAKKLSTARNINGTSFNGTSDITTDKWGKSRTLHLSGDVSGSKTMDGGSDVEINVTVKDNTHNHTVSNISDLTATASELNVLDGIAATTEELNYIKGATENIQTQLDACAPLANPVLTGTPKAPTAPSGNNTTQIATTAFTQAAVSGHNTSATAHNDIRDLISGLTTRLNALADSDDTTLDQLSEIVAYIKSNKSLIDGITTSKVSVSDIIDDLTSTAANKPLSAKQGKVLKDLIDAITTIAGNKVDKVSGKGLSTNDYTTAEKNKLSGIASGAEVNVQADWNITDTTNDAYIKNKPTSMPASDVPSWAKAPEKPAYTKSEVGLGNVGNYKAVSTAPSQGLTEEEKQNARANIGAGATNYPYYSNRPKLTGDFLTSFREEVVGTAGTKTNYIANIRTDDTDNAALPQYAAGLSWGYQDTFAYLAVSHRGSGKVFIGGGGGSSGDALYWYRQLAFVDSTVDAAKKATRSQILSAGTGVSIDEAKIRPYTGSAATDNNYIFFQAEEGLNSVHVGINGKGITGVSRALGDKNGNDITTTYLPLSGGTMNGPLSMNNHLAIGAGYRIQMLNSAEKTASSYQILTGNSGELILRAYGQSGSSPSYIDAMTITPRFVVGATSQTFGINAHFNGSAEKLGTTDKGAANHPIYLEAGTPKPCTFTSNTHAANVYMNTSSGNMYYSTASSLRFKNNIAPLAKEDISAEKLYDINVVQYKYNTDYVSDTTDSRYDTFVPGIIAEDVYEKYPIAADYHIDDDGETVIDDWNFRYMIPAMLKLIQDQKKEIDALKNMIQK